MPEIDDRLTALEHELTELRRQLATRDRAGTTTMSPPASSVAEEVNRRSLLRKTGVAIAGAAAGSLVLAGTQAGPAGAAAGGSVIMGASNSADATQTSLTSSIGTGTGVTLLLTNTSSNGTAPHPPLQLTPDASAAVPSASSGESGSLLALYTKQPTNIFDPNGSDGFIDMFFCHRGIDKSASVPRTWGKVLTSSNANFMQFLTTPSRLVNTRTSAKPADNSTNEYTLTGAPTNAVGFVGTITVTDTTADGSYVSVYNGDLATIASPQFSHVNAGLGQTLATGLTVSLGASKKVKVYCFKSANILIDVAAWVVTG
jgi:hypothetical protein